MDFEYYKLLNNPFRTSPSINSDELIWAGMKKLKSVIENRINISIKTTPSRIVLNWGRYGSGKTHAANYYTKTNYIEDTFKCRTKNLKVNLPRGSKEPIQAFLRALLGQLNFEKIIQDFEEFKSIYQGNSISIIESFTQDSIIAQALQILLGPSRIDLLLFPQENDRETLNLMKHFVYGDSSKGTLKSLNLPLGLDDDEQIVNFISGLFNVITYEKNIYKSVFLWIDEFEDLETLSQNSQDRMTTFLRQLLEKCSNNLTIFLNLTLKSTKEFEDLSILLGEALASRVKLVIDFETPSIPEAEEYICELLNNIIFRKVEDVNTENLFYPFNKESIDFLLDNLDRLTARTINESLSLLIELSLIEAEPAPVIDKKFIETYKLEIPAWKN